MKRTKKTCRKVKRRSYRNRSVKRSRRGGLSVLFNAVKNNRTEQVRAIINKLKEKFPGQPDKVAEVINEPGDEGKSVILYAIFINKNLTIAQELLSNGASVREDEVNFFWNRAIMYKDVPLIDLLLNNNIGINPDMIGRAIDYYRNNDPHSATAKIILQKITNKLEMY